MFLQEAIKTLQNQTQNKITYEQIAKVLGVSKQAIGNRVLRNSELQEFEWNKLKNYFLATEKTKNITDFNQTNIINADFYPDELIIFNGQSMEFSQNKIQVQISKELLNPYFPNYKYFVIKANGDSMFPFIKDGDSLIVKYEKNNIIKDNQIYVFCYDSKIFIKRLYFNIDEIIVKSDNPEFKTKYIQKDEVKKLHILGSVIGSVRNY